MNMWLQQSIYPKRKDKNLEETKEARRPPKNDRLCYTCTDDWATRIPVRSVDDLSAPEG